MIKPSIVLLSLVGFLALGFTSGLWADEPKTTATEPYEMDVLIVEGVEPAIDDEEADALSIADRAMRLARLKTLVSALRVAGLVEDLQEKGPFTIFAPSEEAFARLPEGALEKLLADRDCLRTVLRYHVVPARITADTASQFATVKTLQGNELRIDMADGFKVNGAKVIESDIFGANGVIHVIDTVLLPEGQKFPWMEPEEEKHEVEVEEEETSAY